MEKCSEGRIIHVGLKHICKSRLIELGCKYQTKEQPTVDGSFWCE